MRALQNLKIELVEANIESSIMVRSNRLGSVMLGSVSEFEKASRKYSAQLKCAAAILKKTFEALVVLYVEGKK